MKLVVGLGNVGDKYCFTRHNVGFMVVDKWAIMNDVTFKEDKKLKCFIAKYKSGMEDIMLIKPTTFMNLSGEAVIAVINYYKIDISDVIIVYDDLSKHAVSYRALSLLLKRSPGREAYPGDIFYLHSRLLERACKLSDEYGGGSITALPIVETQAGDISAYIPTNVISITDGQIFLTTDLFNAGQRPAVDSGLSVSRVGSSAQIKAMKKVASSLKIELANYNEMLDFSRFGSDLDDTTKSILRHGAVLMEVLKQKQYSPLSMEDEVIDIYVAQSKALDELNPNEINASLERIRQNIAANHKEVYTAIKETKLLSDETKSLIDTAVSEVLKG